MFDSRYDWRRAVVITGFGLFLASCGMVPKWVDRSPDELPPRTPQATPNPVEDGGGGGELLPTIPQDFFHWNASRLPIEVYYDEGFSPTHVSELQVAVEIWNAVVGYTLIEMIATDDLVDHGSMEGIFTTLDDSRNSFLIHPDWDLTDKSSGTIASTVWRTPQGSYEIDQADIIYNFSHFKYSGGSQGDNRPEVDLRTVSLHEIGHFLGLEHQLVEVDQDSIMTPTINVFTDGPEIKTLSIGDIVNIQAVYGCQGEVCDPEVAFERLQEIESR